MDVRPYRRRFTGELAIDPALYELVMHTGSLLDRLLCRSSSPIPVELPAPGPEGPPPAPAAGGAAALVGVLRGEVHAVVVIPERVDGLLKEPAP
jgi:hypothetical protein